MFPFLSVALLGLETDIPTKQFFLSLSSDSLPKWGKDFVLIDMYVWGPISRNFGGIYMNFHRFSKSIRSEYSPLGTSIWRVRLDIDLCLWTWDS